MKINKYCVKDVLDVVYKTSGNDPIIGLTKNNYSDYIPLGKYNYETVADAFKYCIVNKWIFSDKRFFTADFCNSLVFSGLTKEGLCELERLEKELDGTILGFVKWRFSKIIDLLLKIVSIFKA